jgi:hypothetical protein
MTLHAHDASLQDGADDEEIDGFASLPGGGYDRLPTGEFAAGQWDLGRGEKDYVNRAAVAAMKHADASDPAYINV